MYFLRVFSEEHTLKSNKIEQRDTDRTTMQAGCKAIQ